MTRTRPTDPALEAELARGVSLHRAGRAGEAESSYRAVLSRAPEHPYALNYLGALMAAGGRHAEGIELLRRSIRLETRMPVFHLNLADALSAVGKLEAAEAAIRKSLALDRTADALAKLGVIFILRRRLEPARHHFLQALAVDPSHVGARQSLGMIEAQLGRADAARSALRTATALGPSHLDSLNALVAFAAQSGRPAEALVMGWRAAAVAPAFAPVRANLAQMLESVGRREEALRQYWRALVLQPDAAASWSGYGDLQLAAGRAVAAHAYGRRAVCIDPGNPDVLSNLGRSLNPLGRTSEAIALYRQALERAPEHANAQSNLLFALVLDPHTTSETLFAEYRRRDAAQVGTVRRKPLAGAALDPGRRLRVAFLSGDLRDHPIGHLMLGYFEHHDRNAASLHVYSTNTLRDAISARLGRQAETWCDIVGLGDEEAAARIQADGADILVLLAGQTGGNRAGICAFRPAPIQVNMHDLSTSGMKAVDAWITDWTLHPDDTTEGHTESLVRLPSLYLYPRLADAPSVTPPPCLASGAVTFGSFSNPSKINDEVLALWGQVLGAVDGSRLLMAYHRMFDDPAFRSLMLARLRRAGVDPMRVAFDGSAGSRQDHLARLSKMDISLDPFPFTGGTTIFEAMWMGVPPVTLAGHRFAARSAASHLVAAGFPELVAANAADYVAKAVDLAGMPERLAELRRTMRARVAASPLCDTEAYARSLDAAWRSLWTEFCARSPARP